jgi:hypothetical protein
LFEIDYCFTIMLCDGRVYYLIFKEWLRPSSLFNRTDLYNDNAYVTKIKHNKYNVQAIYSFYHNTVRPVIREACYSHLENTCMAASYSHVLFECVYEPRKVSVHVYVWIRVITKLPNSEQSSKGKIKTHKYINRHNQSTTGKLWKP